MKYEIEFPKLKFDEQFIKKLDLPTLFKQETLTTMTRVKQETVAGRTADGGALREYSPGYKRYKELTTGSGRTNLTVTGELLRSMVVEQLPGSDDTSIRFQGTHAPARRRSISSGTRARKVGQHEIKAQAASTAAPSRLARAAKAIGGARSSGRGSSGGGESQPNAALAKHLYDRGFVGWFAYGRKDIERIEKSVLKRINEKLKTLLTK